MLHLYLSVCRVKLYAVNVLSVSFNSPFMLSDNELAVMEEISLRLLAVSSMEAVKAVMSSFLLGSKVQSGKESGLSGAISGNSNSYMNKNKTGGLDKILATSTKWIALVWILLALSLSLI